MNLLCLDFETYFDADYSLSKLTTEEYVRDPRFHPHLVGLSVNYGRPVVVDYTDMPRIFGKISWDNTACLCHHAQFDGFVLWTYFHKRPALWLDTLSMGRIACRYEKHLSLDALATKFGLLNKTVPYNDFRGVKVIDKSSLLWKALADGCAHDVELTLAVFKKLLPFVPRDELRTIDITLRMFTEPALRLDRPRMEAYLSKIVAEKEGVLAKLGVDKTQLHSANKFAGLLKQLGVEPEMKNGKKGPTYAFAKTDDFMQSLLNGDNPEVAALASARLGTKSTIAETRAQRMLDMDTRGRMPVYLKHAGAHTLRWSGGDKMNWQNFTRGSDLRRSVLAPEGYVLCVGDASQIECRVLNADARQDDILAMFASGHDVYCENASRFYGRTITKKDKEERHLGKALELGCGYGMGAPKFKLTCHKGALGGPSIDLTDDQAEQAICIYRDRHPLVVQLWHQAEEVLKGMYMNGFKEPSPWGMCTIQGRRIYAADGTYLDYEPLSYDEEGFFLPTKKGRAKIYGGLLVENKIQFLARAYIAEVMRRVSKNYKIVLTTHDEIVILAKEAEAEQATNYLLSEMKKSSVLTLPIPLDADGGYDVRYSK